ncbi:MAG: flagellar basal body rod protein FlgB [Alphaproteobacteria bacterium]|nr:flagellar basal body rod protein FlgB [Alphaproteobacteria bacterium]
MTTENITLFKALGAKMDFLNQRQRIVAQNIANADTPGYRPKDLVPVKFDSVLKNVTGSNKVQMETTKAGHMAPGGDVQNPKSRKQKDTYEVAPIGNAVVMEEQLIMSGQTVMDYNLMTNLYQKNVRMIQTAIGRGQ